MSLPFSVNSLHRHRKKIICLSLLICFGWIVHHYLTGSGLSSLNEMECSHMESVTMIKELCSLYRQGKVLGDKCDAMCHKGNIQFKRCLNYKGGKHVLLVDCADSCEAGQTIQAVLKMKHIKDKDMSRFLKKIDKELYEMFTYIRVFDSNVHSIDYLIDYKNLAHKIKEMFLNEYSNVIGNENVFTLLWGEGHENFQEVSDGNFAYPINFVRTLWSLLSQNEYKMSIVFEKYSIFPKIYGFCGPLYISEHAPFNENLDHRIQDSKKMSWRKRVSTAVHILKLVQAADSLQTPLHFCDVKTPHFGTTVEGEVRFTDSDTIFTNDTLTNVLRNMPCETDKDCAFFDCLGVCNSEAETCEPYRTNNNLQSVCALILEDKKGNVFEGILANPPASESKKIQDLLNECANTVTSHRGKVAIRRPSQDLITKLIKTLLDSLEYV